VGGKALEDIKKGESEKVFDPKPVEKPSPHLFGNTPKGGIAKVRGGILRPKPNPVSKKEQTRWGRGRKKPFTTSANVSEWCQKRTEKGQRETENRHSLQLKSDRS